MVGERPFHAGQDAGERPQPPPVAFGRALNVGRIGDHRDLEGPQARQGVVGDHDQVHDLGPQALHDPGITPVRHETDILAVRLCRHRQGEFGGKRAGEAEHAVF